MKHLEKFSALFLALLWVFPLLYIVWTSFHSEAYAFSFNIMAPLTVENFYTVLNQMPFAKYVFNTFLLVTFLLVTQFIVCTLAAYAFAAFKFRGSNFLFALIMLQLMIVPEILMMENYKTIVELGLIDTIVSMGLPYIASAFGIFLLRQTFKSIPKELDDAARVEGSSPIGVLFRVYIPLAKPTYIAYGLVSISYHWNNFLWPLIVTNSQSVRPITVGLATFAAPESGVNWSEISAATLLSIAPLLLAFLIFQKSFVKSFMHTGIK